MIEYLFVLVKAMYNILPLLLLYYCYLFTNDVVFSLQHIEREYQALKEEAPRLRSEVERLRKVRMNIKE